MVPEEGVFLALNAILAPGDHAICTFPGYDYTTICSSAPSEILSIIALRAKDVIIAGHLARIQRNMALLDNFFARFSGRFTWVRPQAGTIAFPRLAGGSSLEFCQQVIRDTNIMLLPSTVYGYGIFPHQDWLWQGEHGGSPGQVGGVSARRGIRSGGTEIATTARLSPPDPMPLPRSYATNLCC